jgi:HlyD family secretion protein
MAEIVFEARGPGEAAERLGHEFRVVVKIEVYEQPKALRVPISALFRKGDQWLVFIVRAGRARLTPIEIGQRNSAHAEVLRGLSDGAVVVLHPSDRIADGVRVTASNGGA